jgi:hypothetical protein
LKHAADYITKLPKSESDLPEWQTAIEVLMLCSRSVERVFNPDRKDTHWGKTKALRQHQQAGWRSRAHQAICECRCRGNLVRGERSGRRCVRIGSRTAYAMLVILVLAMVWQVLGSL